MKLAAIKVKPFLKWAGGKSQLLPDIDRLLPTEIKLGKIKRYVEPFVGGGAVFFHVSQLYAIHELIISDVSKEVFNIYKAIQNDAENLIDVLSKLRKEYVALSDEEQSAYFYKIRSEFNNNCIDDFPLHSNSRSTNRAAQLTFLNHTCFNGLFRLNSKGKFNVPFGGYQNPKMFDAVNLKEISYILKQTKILCGDFSSCEHLIDERTFVYLDPPYRPISKTASFNGYVKNDFDDDEQKRLAVFFKRLDERGAKLMLSNSDPKNENLQDNFFENLYKDFRISRVKAARAINSNGAKRGLISELIITNY
jgi:DNA adenine methylase